MNKQQLCKHLNNANLPDYARKLDPECPLDHWISYAVKVLRDGGIETYESCQGSPGHSFPEPTIRFHGDSSEGYKAIAIAIQHSLPVSSLRRFWRIIDGELEGPNWEMTFTSIKELKILQLKAEVSQLI